MRYASAYEEWIQIKSTCMKKDFLFFPWFLCSNTMQHLRNSTSHLMARQVNCPICCTVLCWPCQAEVNQVETIGCTSCHTCLTSHYYTYLALVLCRMPRWPRFSLVNGSIDMIRENAVKLTKVNIAIARSTELHNLLKWDMLLSTVTTASRPTCWPPLYIYFYGVCILHMLVPS